MRPKCLTVGKEFTNKEGEKARKKFCGPGLYQVGDTNLDS